MKILIFPKQKVGSFVELNKAFHKLTNKESVSEVIQKVNPTKSYDNCYNVVAATAARLCGLDVTAKGDTQNGQGLAFDEICKVFKLNPDNGTDVRRVAEPTVDKISRVITKKYAEGDVGAIGIAWNEKFVKHHKDSDAHTLNWIIRNGNVEFMDGQASMEGTALRSILARYMSSDKEASIAKFGNTLKGLDFDADVDLERLRQFVE